MVSAWIQRAALERPAAVYLEEARGSGQLRYGELEAARRRLVARLDHLGVAPGAPVALRAPDPLAYATGFVALLGAGRVVVPLDPGAPAGEQARLGAIARPVATMTGDDIEVHGPASPGADQAAWSGGTGGGVFLATSGTTGAPKGIHLDDARLSHVAAGVARHHGFTPADRGLCPLPLFHINAQVVGLLATLAGGASLVLDDRFHRRGFWELVADRGITWINAAPAIIAVLGATAEADRPPNRVRFVRSASAPLPVVTLTRFERDVGLPVLESYGMTEAASMVTANPLGGPRKRGSVGPPVGTEVRVVDRHHRPRPGGEVGRVEIRGPGVIGAYAVGGPPGAVSEEGWLDTGDLGYLDADGYLYLVGRADDVINRGGENVHPREVEEVLLAHPDVAQAAVVGLPDPVLGARPAAYVVPAAGTRREADLVAELRARCSAELSAFKVPGEVRLVARLPVGATGKVARRRVVAEVAAPGS
ncbi:MAG TPA: AMP-binding protein [Acidimicrobiales bacterium]|nr:AMP-binding protein [Acidimicrobiales bacterium]